MSADGNHVPIGRSLKFSVESCTVQPPYDVYWNVRNAGIEVVERKSLHGEITNGGDTRFDNPLFPGNHWVQAWVVENGVAVVTDTRDATITKK